MLQALAGLLKPAAANGRRWGLDVTSASACDEFCGVQTLPVAFRDLLDETPDEILRETMESWSQTEELRSEMKGTPAEEHLQFVLRLQALAHEARQAKAELYFYWRE